MILTGTMHFVGAGKLSAWLPPDASSQAVAMAVAVVFDMEFRGGGSYAG